MSQYVYFFIDYDNHFIPIGEFSRNNKISQYVKYVPYEKIAPLSKQDLSNIARNIQDDISAAKLSIQHIEQEIKTIPSYNNTMMEKQERIADLKQDIVEQEFELDELYYADGFYNTLLNAIECVEYNEEIEEDIDVNKYIYAGWETGTNVSKKDIREDF